jgi:tetratricopeptide (TPR) repeat protein
MTIWARGNTAGSLGGPAVLVLALMMVVGAASCARPHAAAVPVPVIDVGAAGTEAIRDRLRSVPSDHRAWAALGAEYVQQARRSGDPTYYPKAERALKRSLQLSRADNFEAMFGMATLASARHDFAGALRWARGARELRPHNSAVYGALGDALIELGHYHEGFDALQRMVDLRPGLASYARASYAWELQGETRNAIETMKLAEQAAATPTDAAFAAYQLGELYWNSGRTDAAAASYRRSRERDASFVPALEGLAKTDAARGENGSAIHRYRSVVERSPIPQYVAELHDLYAASGDRELAEQQAGVLDVQERLFRASGVNMDLEQAIFHADHGLGDRGLAAAQAEWRKRKSIFAADALAWALHANGRDAEALPYAKRAMRIGTRNALFHFHKGTIEHALGLRVEARRDLEEAMRINPHFSFLWAPEVREMLEELR